MGLFSLVRDVINTNAPAKPTIRDFESLMKQQRGDLLYVRLESYYRTNKERLPTPLKVRLAVFFRPSLPGPTRANDDLGRLPWSSPKRRNKAAHTPPPRKRR